MSLELVPVIGVPLIVVLAALLGLVLRSRRRRHRPDPLPLSEALSADEVAYRIGVIEGPRRRIAPLFELLPRASRTTVLPPAASMPPAQRPTGSTVQGTAGPLRPTPAAAEADPSPRERLVRDTGAALASLAAIVLLAVALWPGAPTGGVLGIAGQPGAAPDAGGVILPQAAPSGSATAQSDDQPGESPGTSTVPPSSAAPRRESSGGASAAANPRPRSTPVPTPTPRVTPTPATGPGASPSTIPSASPSPAPTPTPGSVPTPRPDPIPDPTAPPTPAPTPTPSPTPSPTPTPTPTPDPTPEPTPEPTPTPDPTPEPTPDPTPEPTPEPTP
jgi:hypothetical protein